jgi:hypothetical protein
MLRSFAGSFNVKAFGAMGDGHTDDSAAFLAAFQAAKGSPVYAPAGNYILRTTFQHLASGNVGGLKIYGDGKFLTYLIFHVTNGPAFDLQGSRTPYQFQYDGFIKDMTIYGESTADGISVVGNWHFTIQNVWIQGFRDAVVLPDRPDLGVVDGWNSAFFTIMNCDFRFNHGWGLHAINGPGSELTVDSSTIEANEGGGLYVTGYHARIINDAIAFNGSADVPSSGGLVFAYGRYGNPMGAVVEGNEFESNLNFQLWALAADTLSVRRNKLNAKWKNGAIEPPVGIRIGGAGRSVRYFDLEQNMYVSDNTGMGAPENGNFVAILFADPKGVQGGAITREYAPTLNNTPNLIKYGVLGAGGTVSSTLPASISNNVTIQ